MPEQDIKEYASKTCCKVWKSWDWYLPGVLRAYRNTPHEATKEKPSYLLFGLDCLSPTEAAFLPVEPSGPVDIAEYREEVVLYLLQESRLLLISRLHIETTNASMTKHSVSVRFKVGDLVLVRFPNEETGKNRKFSRPRHGPYTIVQCNNPDVTVVKQFFPEEGAIQVHQLRVCACPQLPVRYYWYGGNRHSAAKTPEWVERLLTNGSCSCQNKSNELVGQHKKETNSECNDKTDGDKNGDKQVEIRKKSKYTSYEGENNEGTDPIFFPKELQSQDQPSIRKPRYNLRDHSTRKALKNSWTQFRGELQS